MRPGHTRWLLPLLVLLALLPLLPTPRAHAAPGFALQPCPFAVPRDLQIDCGLLTVAEDRANPDSASINLMVSIVRGNGQHPDPVVYLSGGPGSGAVAETLSLARGWWRLHAGRDLIVVDQRGTGFSTPSLACPESDAVTYDLLTRHVTRAEKVAAEFDGVQRCRDRLRAEGVNLAAYTSAASAADLEDLRTILGYGPWNLLGISYGTRLALTALRDHPEGLRSVILDSTYPPEVHLYRDMPASLERALGVLFQGCAADTGCAARYPDLEATFYALVERLDAEPVQVWAYDPQRGHGISIAVDGSELLSLTFKMLYSTSSLPALPRMIAAAAAGDYGPLSALERKRLGRAGNFSHGMYFAVQCSEEIPFASDAELAAALKEHPRLAHYFSGIIENTPTIGALCAALGVAAPDPKENQPVAGDVPALVLAGDYDPITPPEWGQASAAHLRTSYFYRFPATGHAVITRGSCPVGMVRAFLDDPGSAPDSSCIDQIGPPAFE